MNTAFYHITYEPLEGTFLPEINIAVEYENDEIFFKVNGHDLTEKAFKKNENGEYVVLDIAKDFELFIFTMDFQFTYDVLNIEGFLYSAKSRVKIINGKAEEFVNFTPSMLEKFANKVDEYLNETNNIMKEVVEQQAEKKIKKEKEKAKKLKQEVKKEKTEKEKLKEKLEQVKELAKKKLTDQILKLLHGENLVFDEAEKIIEQEVKDKKQAEKLKKEVKRGAKKDNAQEVVNLLQRFSNEEFKLAISDRYQADIFRKIINASRSVKKNFIQTERGKKLYDL